MFKVHLIVFCFSFRLGISPISERDEKSASAERNHLHRYRKGPVRQILPQAANNGIFRFPKRQNLHPRFFQGYVLRARGFTVSSALYFMCFAQKWS